MKRRSAPSAALQHAAAPHVPQPMDVTPVAPKQGKGKGANATQATPSPTTTPCSSATPMIAAAAAAVQHGPPEARPRVVQARFAVDGQNNTSNNCAANSFLAAMNPLAHYWPGWLHCTKEMLKALKEGHDAGAALHKLLCREMPHRADTAAGVDIGDALPYLFDQVGPAAPGLSPRSAYDEAVAIASKMKCRECKRTMTNADGRGLCMEDNGGEDISFTMSTLCNTESSEKCRGKETMWDVSLQNHSRFLVVEAARTSKCKPKLYEHIVVPFIKGNTTLKCCFTPVAVIAREPPTFDSDGEKISVGHFVCFTRLFGDNTWSFFNDSQVNLRWAQGTVECPEAFTPELFFCVPLTQFTAIPSESLRQTINEATSEERATIAAFARGVGTAKAFKTASAKMTQKQRAELVAATRVRLEQTAAARVSLLTAPKLPRGRPANARDPVDSMVLEIRASRVTERRQLREASKKEEEEKKKATALLAADPAANAKKTRAPPVPNVVLHVVVAEIHRLLPRTQCVNDAVRQMMTGDSKTFWSQLNGVYNFAGNCPKISTWRERVHCEQIAKAKILEEELVKAGEASKMDWIRVIARRMATEGGLFSVDCLRIVAHTEFPDNALPSRTTLWRLMRNSWKLVPTTKPITALPVDHETRFANFVAELVLLITLFDVTPDCILNIDEQSVRMWPELLREWVADRKQTRMVSPLLRGVTRACVTMLHCISAAGKILESQVIWEGASERMFSDADPKRDIDGEQPRMMHQTFSESHWTTVKTLLEYFEYLEVFRRAQSKISGRDEKMIVCLDWAPVHVSCGFREAFYAKFPNIFLLYVPRNCTSRYQPLDVIFMGIFKPYMRMLQQQVVTVGMYSLTKGQQLLLDQQLTRDVCFSAACDTLAHMKQGTSLGAEMVIRCWTEAGLGFCTQRFDKKKMTAAWERAWEMRNDRVNNAATSLFEVPIPSASHQIMAALHLQAVADAMTDAVFPVDYNAIGQAKDDCGLEVESDDDDCQLMPEAEWKAQQSALRQAAGKRGGRNKGSKRSATTVDLPGSDDDVAESLSTRGPNTATCLQYDDSDSDASAAPTCVTDASADLAAYEA